MDKKELIGYNKERKRIYNRLLNEIGKLVSEAEIELKKLNKKLEKSI